MQANEQPGPMRPLLFLIALLALAASAGAVVAADSAEFTAHSFQVVLTSEVKTEFASGTQNVEADAEFRYTWQRKNQERNLIMDSMFIEMSMDGKPMMNTFMSRETFRDIRAGATNEVSVEKAPDRLKKMLQASFGVPVCRLRVDSQGKEVSRKVIAGPGATELLDNGMIGNALLFHPPFLPDADEWQVDKEVGMGDGRVAKGTLTYKKLAAEQTGHKVKVSGILTSEKFRKQGSPLTIGKAHYVVSGEQIYDPVQQEWLSGKLTMKISFQMTADDKPAASSKGTLSARFEKLAATK